MAKQLRILALSLVITACSTKEAPAPQPAQPEPTSQFTPYGQDTDFAAFLRDFRVTALSQGIAPALYDSALGHIRLNPRIRELDSAQPEFVKPIWDYLDSAVSSRRIADGQATLSTYADLLAQIESRSGVPKEILLAIWGNETNYGRFMGSFNLFEALAPLAYEGRRTDYGRTQLLAALKVAQAGPFTPSLMTASWAGAFGQTQFIPTTWLAHAVDFDGDGKKDVWNSTGDALASAAALLTYYGWKPGARWGYEVKLPASFPYAEAELDLTKPLAQWRALGITTATGATLPPEAAEDSAAIILPAGARGPAFLVFNNFKTVLRYNNAVSYGLAVCLLADRIAGAPPLAASWPRDEQVLMRSERIQFQQALQRLGQNPGEADGVLGRQTRAALRAYQQQRGLPADGFPTKALLTRILSEF